ncbi:MAG TPA: diacylglycerol kinase family protein [Bacteroidales bacterium]|nr:diacylglycerol kinase family protein [Bacteroidales bacterium]
MNWIVKRIKSFGYAFAGIYRLFRHEANAQIHLLATIVVISAGIYFQLRALEWALVCLAIGVVIAAEAFNSAIEKLTDGMYPEKHDNAMHVKDMAAGAVLIAAIAAVAIAVFVFGGHLGLF